MIIYEIDPSRANEPETGIYVRARAADGRWVNADIAHLQKKSLHEWLRSRGGENIWAENVVALLLGHAHFDQGPGNCP